jgi:DNA-binding transcriptional MerR regulator
VSEQRTYTLSELEQLTGVTGRTIYYYVKLGLLPSVGRRGRGTRYGQVHLDRLRLIVRIRSLQDQGLLPPVTLEQMVEPLDALSEAQLEHLASDASDEEVIGLMTRHGVDLSQSGPTVDTFESMAWFDVEAATPDLPNGALAMAPASLVSARRRKYLRGLGRGEIDESPGLHPEVREQEIEFGLSREATRLLARLDRLARENEPTSDSSGEQWTHLPVTRNLSISIRNLPQDPTNSSLARRLVELLRAELEDVDDPESP